jgi:hypothetical protein
VVSAPVNRLGRSDTLESGSFGLFQAPVMFDSGIGVYALSEYQPTARTTWDLMIVSDYVLMTSHTGSRTKRDLNRFCLSVFFNRHYHVMTPVFANF